jgi:hypothetical protein
MGALRSGVESLLPESVSSWLISQVTKLLILAQQYPIAFGAVSFVVIVGLSFVDMCMRQSAAERAYSDATVRRQAVDAMLSEMDLDLKRTLRRGEQAAFIRVRIPRSKADADMPSLDAGGDGGVDDQPSPKARQAHVDDVE